MRDGSAVNWSKLECEMAENALFKETFSYMVSASLPGRLFSINQKLSIFTVSKKRNISNPKWNQYKKSLKSLLKEINEFGSFKILIKQKYFDKLPLSPPQKLRKTHHKPKTKSEKNLYYIKPL